MEHAKDAVQLTVEGVTSVWINLSLDGKECLNSVACRDAAKGLNSYAMVSYEELSPPTRPYSVFVNCVLYIACNYYRLYRRQ